MTNFSSELALAYKDFGKHVISTDQPSFFENTSFTFTKENGDTIRYTLHIDDIVSIGTDELGEGFAIIRGIFCHWNNAFIIVDWFEETNLTKLDCPVYRLQVGSNWRRIFSISIVNAINTAHFVHNCKDGECIEGSHDVRNNMYIRNMYFFKAV